MIANRSYNGQMRRPKSFMQWHGEGLSIQDPNPSRARIEKKSSKNFHNLKSFVYVCNMFKLPYKRVIKIA